jgi:hypothetical protein
MVRVTVTPDPFTLVPYDVGEIVALVEDVAAMVDFPRDVPIDLEVDEELFAPLTGTMADVADGRARLWVSGANFEDSRRPRHFAPEQARVDIACMLLRVKDRLSDDFAGAPPDAQLSRGERAAWDVYAVGRAGRLGMAVRRPKQLYDYRLQHGFTDVADAAFDRLWTAEKLTWAGIGEICKQTGAADRPTSKVPVDLLRASGRAS